MTYLKRYYSKKIKSNLLPNKVLVVYGPRQVGKTTMVNNFLKTYSGKVYQSTGENADLKNILESSSFSKIIPFFAGYDLVVIDEAQKIKNIGQSLKIIVDQIKNIRVLATGSSSFDLANKIGEPLVGRQRIIKLFPLAVMELIENYGRMYVQENLGNLLVFGSYPEVILAKSFKEKRNILTLIRDAYLFKDILELENIKNSEKILSLLKLIALQIGKEVSLQELGNSLEMSKNTVERYLDLLEKTFIIKRVFGFSRNLRKEITKTSRFYFLDNGIRNAVISNFNDLDSRDDVGMLWENFLFVERMKKREYKQIFANQYFWRTWDKKEIDLVEERDGRLFGYEFKWRPKKTNPPADWLKAYPEAEYKVITPENYFDFVS